MASIASKNLYELLGNDPELDPDRPADPPTKVVEHPSARLGKRNGPSEAPAPSPATGSIRSDNNRRANGATGSERAYNDRNAGASENRRRAPDDGLRQDRHPDRIRADRGEYRGRGRGRGASGGGGNARSFNAARPDDRRSKTGINDHEKQLAHGWGGTSGTQEYDDEKAGDAIAKEEEKAGFDTTVPAPVDADGNVLPESGDAAPAENAAPAEPEGPKAKSYDDYLAEQTEKKLALGSLDIRKPNEGASKKFPEGKAFAREEQQDFFVGGGEKKTRERTKKEKQTLELDADAMRPAQQDDRPRGGRGGGRGRGGDRDRSDRPERREPREPREPRGDGEQRAPRGDGERRGRGGRGGDRPRGEFRGGRGGAGGGRGGGPAGPNIGDSSAFPSLGA